MAALNTRLFDLSSSIFIFFLTGTVLQLCHTARIDENNEGSLLNNDELPLSMALPLVVEKGGRPVRTRTTDTNCVNCPGDL
jgi:hypothetical protein